MTILYCIDCEKSIEPYSDGSNIEKVINFFFEHKNHKVKKVEGVYK